MTLFTPLWMQAASGDPAIQYSAQADRALWRAIFNVAGVLNANLAPPKGDLQVSQRAAGANFSVDIAPGYAIIPGGDAPGQGFYTVASDATENRTIPSPPASGSRTHRVVARIKDKLYSGAWATYEWTLEVLEDTGSGTPAIPTSALSLATVTVTAGDTAVTDASITDTRVNAVFMQGAIGRWIGSDALRPKNPIGGEYIWRTDKACEEQWDGSGWREVLRRDGGGSAWSTYTPTWSSSGGTQPNIGSGSRLGRYMQIGKRVIFVAEITMASNTTYGSGNWSIGLPPVAARTSPGQIAIVRATDTSAGVAYDGQAVLGATTTTPTVSAGNAWLNSVTQGVPFTWATGDILRVSGEYEAT